MTLETTPTEFVEAAGTRFAYRKLGSSDGPPLVCLQHFKLLRDAQLILYPDAGHGALFQYPERFVSHAAFFLAE